MKYILYLAAILFCCSFSPAEYRNPPVLVEEKIYDYVEGIKESVKLQKPLIVYVGCYPKYLTKNVVVCHSLYLEGYPAQCVVVAFPSKDWVNLGHVLSRFAEQKEIDNAVNSFNQKKSNSYTDKFGIEHLKILQEGPGINSPIFRQSIQGCST